MQPEQSPASPESARGVLTEFLTGIAIAAGKAAVVAACQEAIARLEDPKPATRSRR